MHYKTAKQQTVALSLTFVKLEEHSKKKRRKFIHRVYYPLPFSALIVLRTLKTFFDAISGVLVLRLCFMILLLVLVSDEGKSDKKKLENESQDTPGFLETLIFLSQVSKLKVSQKIEIESL